MSKRKNWQPETIVEVADAEHWDETGEKLTDVVFDNISDDIVVQLPMLSTLIDEKCIRLFIVEGMTSYVNNRSQFNTFLNARREFTTEEYNNFKYRENTTVGAGRHFFAEFDIYKILNLISPKFIQSTPELTQEWYISIVSSLGMHLNLKDWVGGFNATSLVYSTNNWIWLDTYDSSDTPLPAIDKSNIPNEGFIDNLLEDYSFNILDTGIIRLLYTTSNLSSYVGYLSTPAKPKDYLLSIELKESLSVLWADKLNYLSKVDFNESLINSILGEELEVSYKEDWLYSTQVGILGFGIASTSLPSPSELIQRNYSDYSSTPRTAMRQGGAYTSFNIGAVTKQANPDVYGSPMCFKIPIIDIIEDKFPLIFSNMDLAQKVDFLRSIKINIIFKSLPNIRISAHNNTSIGMAINPDYGVDLQWYQPDFINDTMQLIKSVNIPQMRGANVVAGQSDWNFGGTSGITRDSAKSIGNDGYMYFFLIGYAKDTLGYSWNEQTRTWQIDFIYNDESKSTGSTPYGNPLGNSPYQSIQPIIKLRLSDYLVTKQQFNSLEARVTALENP